MTKLIGYKAKDEKKLYENKITIFLNHHDIVVPNL